MNEIVVQRLMNLLEIDHLEYTLIHAIVTIENKDYETYLCESEDYKNPDEGKVSLEDFYSLYREEGESPFDFCKRMGWEKYVYEMFLIDYLVLNRDRHGANIEILRDLKTKTVQELKEYEKEETRQGYWEDVYMRHIQDLPMKARKCGNGIINEFDSIDELRCFDESYINDTRSSILKRVCEMLSCQEAELNAFKRIKHTDDYLLFSFKKDNDSYIYDGRDASVKRIIL